MENKTIIDQNIANWQRQAGQMLNVIAKLSNEQLKRDVAPGKNSGLYLVGHLAAANEHMLTLLDLGEKKYPELTTPFVHTPDKNGQEAYDADRLRMILKEVTDSLTEKLSSLTVEDWFSRHTSVSPEDFEKEPHRNKLSILLSRTLHMAYHTGQLVLLS
jgi:uncharacterized damage-inducible protein DinB